MANELTQDGKLQDRRGDVRNQRHQDGNKMTGAEAKAERDKMRVETQQQPPHEPKQNKTQETIGTVISGEDRSGHGAACDVAVFLL